MKKLILFLLVAVIVIFFGSCAGNTQNVPILSDQGISNEPLVVMSQGWEYTITSISNSDRLPEGVTRKECRQHMQLESYYEETAINNDGSAADGYFFITVELSMENISSDFVTGRDDNKWNINGLTLYARDKSKSTYLYPDYVSESCYDEIRDADDLTLDYSAVDFSNGKVDLTISYLVKDELYEEYDRWELLLNLDGISADDYDRLTKLNGEPPFARISLGSNE